ncbi:hypothetical protein A3H11_01215 [Candidatus Uhrbacteria bacterium RIFCSPLOWO2_12_FULL_47_10]|nr:MAG: hypothetical protein A3H11_01215 [Candidatus Uhrbacteria bacterium RIFCSPLOWO2_12_FULL_47_10]
MSQFSSFSFNLNTIFGREPRLSFSKKNFGGLFLIAALIVAAIFIAPQLSRAGVPVYSGGGPPNGQSFAPPDALIDINANEAMVGASVNQSSVTLLECTGATEPTSCPGTTGTTLCTGVTLGTGSNGANTRIVCDHAPLGTERVYRFSVDTAAVTASTGQGAASNRIFKTGSFTGGTNTTLPTIMGTVPTPGSFDVPTNTKIFVEFPMGPEGNMLADSSVNSVTYQTANDTNLSLKSVSSSGGLGSEVCVTGGCTLAWDAMARRLKVTPAAVLLASTDYDLCVRSRVRNSSAQNLAGDYCAHFRTGAGADTTAPALRATAPLSPASGATGVSRFVSSMDIAFSEAIDPSTLNVGAGGTGLGRTFSIYGDQDSSSTLNGAESAFDADLVSMVYDPGQKTARLTLKGGALPASTRLCYLFITNGVKDLAGNALAASSNQCFTTGNDTDTTAPTLLYADADSFKLIAHFSEQVRAASALNSDDALNPANYSMECPVGVATNLTGKTLIYHPDFKEVEIQGLGLQAGQSCRLTVGTPLKDLAGNTFSATTNVANFTILDPTVSGGNLGGSGSTEDFMSGTNFAEFWENPQRCFPRAQVTSAATTVECEFPVPQALTTNATFLLTFPSGFTVTSADDVATSSSFTNGDLNGPGPGITTISGVVADNAAGTVTVTIAHALPAMGSADRMRFELTGITNPTSPATDARISVIVKDNNGVKVGQTIKAAPFNIGQAGALSISGSVYKDSNNNGTKDAGEGINSVRVFCDPDGSFGTGVMAGHQEVATSGNGGWTINGVSAGQYNCNLPPDPVNFADLNGANFFQKVTLADANKTGVDFKFADLSLTGATLTANISGGPASTQVDVFCNAGAFDYQFAAPITKVVTLDGSGAGTATLKLQPGKTYDCGMGPHLQSAAFAGGPPPVPTFSFMPPQNQRVVVPAAGNPSAITFALTNANLTISGSVVDGSNAGIANVFVHADPLGCFDATTGAFMQCQGSFAQSKSDGTFTLNVGPGTYIVGADGPGLPPSTFQTVNVSGSNVTGVILKMAKSSVTIAGQILDESGNGIQYAHVSGERIATGGTCASFTPMGGFADSPTDGSGNYTLYVANGTWCLRAFAPAYGQVGTKTVVISSGTSATGQNIQATAADYGTISGTITKASAAVNGAFVNCFSPTAGGGNHAQSGTDGTFSMKVKAGASYNCDGFLPGAGPLTASQSNFTVTGGATSTVNMSITGEPGTVNVTVTGITDAFVDVRNSSGRGSGTSQNSSGVYSIKVPAGTYTVRGGGPKYGELCAGQSVTVTAGGTHAITCAPPSTLRTVTGQITDGTSNVPGASVTFTSSAGKIFTATTGNQTGSNDNLSSANIPDGTYTVTVSKQGYAPASTSATVSGGNFDFASAVAMTPTTGTSGDDVKIQVQADSTAYTGTATVVATSSTGTTVVGSIDKTTGIATMDLSNGTWTVTAIGDNGKKTTSASTITVTSGDFVGPDSGTVDETLSLATTISGYSAASESETLALSSGGLLKFEGLAVGGTSPEINIPSSTLSTTDSSTGKVEMATDPTLAGIDPGTNQNFVGTSGYDITPKDANGNPIKDLNGSVTITIPYTDANVTSASVSESTLTIGSFNTTTQSWETFSTTIDTTNNLLIAEITHFSSFGIIGGVSTAASSGGAVGDLTAPAPATNVKLTVQASPAKVTVTWTDPTDSDFRKVEILRNDGNGGEVSGTSLATVAAGVQKYDDTEVTSGKTYKYILKSRDTSNNQGLTAEYSVTVTAAASATSGGGAGTTTTAPTTTTTTAPATTTTTTTTTTTAPAATAAPVAVVIHDPSKLDALLTALSATRSTSEEAKYMPLIKSDAIAFKVGLTAEQEATITNFVTYGASDKTVKLGAGERRAVMRDYLETVGRGNVNWDDVERMTKGEKPVSRNLEKERAQVGVALKVFVKIYGHSPVFSDAKEDLAWNTLLYRIRFTRDLTVEKEGIVEFRATYGRTPKSTMDWATVRVLGYVK